MIFYISFGQIHKHSIGGRTIDKDCLVSLSADSRDDAHEKATEIFSGVFHNVYEEKPDMQFFPRGVIEL